MRALILGSRSDIAADLQVMMVEDGWTIRGWHRGARHLPQSKWNLCLITLGCLAPVGHWAEIDQKEFDACVQSNALLPLKLLRDVWYLREPNASVCFFGGSNPQKLMAGYSAYNFAKMGLLKLVEQLDLETPDAKIFVLGPGFVRTKIHQPTAKWFEYRRKQFRVM